MNRANIAEIFRSRLDLLLSHERRGTAQFLRDTGVDRSALSQFRDTRQDRLPRAETLRRIAEARHVSIDWLLGLENAPEGRQTVATSVSIERERDEREATPLDRWRTEAEGGKLRYVPSTLPDMLSLACESTNGDARPEAGVEPVLDGVRLGDTDVEIAMPRQTLEDLAWQTGLWRGRPAGECRRAIEFMAGACEALYPRLRLYLYDGRETFSAPFTVFGKRRAAIYIGDAYLSVTAQEQVRAFVDRFDTLVRRAAIGPERVHTWLRGLSDRGPGL